METFIPPPTAYRLQEILGEGLNSCVYKAIRQDPAGHIQQVVALKILNSENLVKLWRREFAALSRVRSPFCVGLMGWEWVNGKPALVLEYVNGVTLERLKNSGQLTEQQIEDICWQIHQGLLDLRRAELCHGDMNFGNILVDVEGHVRLVDFGLANTSGTVLWLTPAYAAPEVLSGEKPNHLSDLFGLGAIERELRNFKTTPRTRTLMSPDREQRLKATFQPVPEARLSLGELVENILRASREQSTKKLENNILKNPLPNYRRKIVACVVGLCLTIAGQWPHASGTAFEWAALSFRSKKWAMIILDGQKVGYAPLDLTVAAGRHIVEWQWSDGRAQRTLTLRNGEHIFINDPANE